MQQHDAHIANWLKHNFNLTVEKNDINEFIAFEGDWDLDIKYATDDTIFGAALEYTACYNGALNDRLVELEMGFIPERIQLPNNYMKIRGYLIIM